MHVDDRSARASLLVEMSSLNLDGGSSPSPGLDVEAVSASLKTVDKVESPTGRGVERSAAASSQSRGLTSYAPPPSSAAASAAAAMAVALPILPGRPDSRRASTQDSVQIVSELLKEFWFCYLYPAIMFSLGLTRRGTITGGMYGIVALLLCFTGGGPYWHWCRKTAPLPRPGKRCVVYASILSLLTLIFIVACVLEALCYAGVLAPQFNTAQDAELEAFWIYWLRIGPRGPNMQCGLSSCSNCGRGPDDTGVLTMASPCCSAPMSALPEAAALLVTVAAWLFFWWFRSLLTGAVLVASAALDCNAFAGAYYFAAVLAMTAFAYCFGANQCSAALVLSVKWALFVVAFLQILVSSTLSLTPLAKRVPRMVMPLLGLSGSGDFTVSDRQLLQILGSFILLQILVHSNMLKADPQIQTDAADEGLEGSSQALSPHRQVSDDVADRSIGMLASLPVVDSAPVHSNREAFRAAPASWPVPAAPRLSQSRRLSRQQTSDTIAEIVGSVNQHNYRGLRGRLDSLASFATTTTQLYMWCAYYATKLGSSMLPLLSMMCVPFLWPCVAASPLLLVGLAIMHIPWRTPALPLTTAAFVYEAIAALTNYGYTVYCRIKKVPLSNIPASFTAAEMIGLQSLLRKQAYLSTALQFSLLVAGQASALFVLSLGMRFAKLTLEAPDSEVGNEGGRRMRGLVTQVTVWSMRVMTVVVLLYVIFSREYVNSLFSLGYLLWLILLGAHGLRAPFERTGWDTFRGGALLWRGLLLYCQLILVIHLVWQVGGIEDQPFLGLVRDSSWMLRGIGHHFVIGMLASVQISAIYHEVGSPDFLLRLDRTPLSSLIRHASFFGTMLLTFVVVMMTPASADMIVYLLLFMLTVSMEQFGDQVRRRTWPFTACIIFTAIVLPIRYFATLQAAQEWLARHHLDQPPLKLEATNDIQEKLVVLSVLYLATAHTKRLLDFHNAQLDQRGQTAPEFLSRLPAFVLPFFRWIAVWSDSLLMLVAYFPVIVMTGALPRLQLVFLLVMLVASKWWRRAGTMISVTSMALLLGQYILQSSLRLMPQVVTDHVNKTYLGLEWSNDLLLSEVLLILFGIMQSAVQRAILRSTVVVRVGEALHHHANGQLSPGRRPPKVAPVKLPRTLLEHSAHIGSFLVVLVSMYRGSVWSIAMMTAVLSFVLSRDSARGLTKQKSSRRLLILMLLMALELMQQWFVESWLPPDMQPTAADVAKWAVCDQFENTANVTSDGDPCSPLKSSMSGCSTQRYRCGVDWEVWTGLTAAPNVWTSLPTFFAIWCMSILRKGNVAAIKASGAGLNGANAAGGDAADDDAPDDDAAAAATVSAAVGDPEARSPLGLAGESSANSIATTMADTAATYSFRTALLMWLALAGVFTSQQSTNAVTAVYVLLLFLHLYVFFDHEKTLKRRVNIVRAIRTFNVIVLVLFKIFECPSVPCPFALPINDDVDPQPGNDLLVAISQDVWLQSAHYMSWEQCANLMQTSGADEGTKPDIVTVFMKSMGLFKDKGPYTFNSDDLWNCLVFAATSLHLLVSAAWRTELEADRTDRKDRIREREAWYQMYLAAWRKRDLSMWSAKKEALQMKLDNLSQRLVKLAHLGKMALIEDAATHRRTSRLLNLSLNSGYQIDVVGPVLDEFDEVVREALLAQELRDTEQEPKPGSLDVDLDPYHDEIDEKILSYLSSKEKLELKEITSLELEARKEAILKSCAELPGPQGRPGALSFTALPQPSLIAITSSFLPASAEYEAGDDEECALADAAAAAAAAVPDAGTATDDAPGTRGEGETADCEDADNVRASVASSAHVASVAELWLNKLIDDLLFMRPHHGTLSVHRESDSLPRLITKVIASQTRPLLLVVSALQFCCYRSVLSAIANALVILSFMAFPHPSALYWASLLNFNMAVFILKMAFQLPVFCATGLITSDGCPTVTDPSVPWEAIIGFAKVGTTSYGLYPTFPTILAYIWADLLACVLLFFHLQVLREGGRLGDPYTICRRLEDDDTPFSVADHPELENTGSASVEPNTPPSMAPETTPRAEPDSGPGSSVAAASCSPEEEEGPPDDSAAADAQPSWRMRMSMSASYLSSTVGEVFRPRDPAQPQEPFCKRIVASVTRLVIGHSAMRKPSLDLYTSRFVLELALLVMLILTWPYLSGIGQSFQASLTNSSFSASQVKAVVAFLILTLLDRALYTWYTQDRGLHRHVNGAAARESQIAHGASAVELGNRASYAGSSYHHAGTHERGSAIMAHRTTSQSPSERVAAGASMTSLGPPRQSSSPPGTPTPEASSWNPFATASVRTVATTAQKILLVTQLIVLHVLCVQLWVDTAAFGQPDLAVGIKFPSWLSIFYFVYVTFLALTSLQLKYNVHIVQGGLAITHNTSTISWLLLKVYQAVPFMEELRVLMDFTVTMTSLQFFMWMKLEDAQQSLYNVKVDMLYRRSTAFAEPRPLSEKLVQGGCQLLLIFALIIGPIVYFSSLNTFLMPDLVVDGTLRAGLQVKMPTGKKSLMFYDSTQLTPTGNDDELTRAFIMNHTNIGIPVTVQRLTFPQSSDSFWMVSQELRMQMASFMNNYPRDCYFFVSYSFTRNITSAPSAREDSILLQERQVDHFVELLNSTTIESGSVKVQNLFQQDLFINTASQVTELGSVTNKSIMEVILQADSGGLPSWSIVTNSSDPAAGDSPSFVAASQKAPPGTTSSQGSAGNAASTITVTSIYLGIVYTIGRFLRFTYQDSSKRILYEELPDTDLLHDLCDGIYIARIQGNLETEFRLYYELIRIYRSPLLLGEVSGEDYLDDDKNMGARPSFAGGAGGIGRHSLRPSSGGMLPPPSAGSSSSLFREATPQPRPSQPRSSESLLTGGGPPAAAAGGDSTLRERQTAGGSRASSHHDL
eukprot:TRINITY_DN53122_c0_g2_i1.p1 TRINITY_DN53122_c0_g2~~TRINITY_DN53122_c0_g2_i1.p1  ORF type:complete len:2885 (-),score=452.52 TRINITY_DN53122_c0_g2_i1:224-8878(-)